MKKVIFFYIMFMLCFAVFATSEVVSNQVNDIREQVYLAFGTFLIALLGILTKTITNFVNGYVESKKDKRYYEALKYAEDVILALVAEEEGKAVKKIKEKFIDDPDNSEKYVELGKVANRVIDNALTSIPNKHLEELNKHENGLLPNLIKPVLAKHRWLGNIDFRDLRDKLNIPKI